MAKRKNKRDKAKKKQEDIQLPPPRLNPMVEPAPDQELTSGSLNPGKGPEDLLVPQGPNGHPRQNARLSEKLGRWQKKQTRQWRKHSRYLGRIPAALWLFLGFLIFFVWESFLEPTISPIHALNMIQGKIAHLSVQGFLNVQVRSIGMILAAMFTLCAIVMAFQEIKSVDSPYYWEVTDRHQQLDYVSPELRSNFEFIKEPLSAT